ncbi:hypothetical protein HPB48_016399 [Haemaphysalis longicornis]|uniref:Uncharacterized protein n=1 Tax=Haemaphysalis longicornis TaxID=44386 RepID=A0A9J6GUI7_HAELO|nr:hypothetical protein HPB48_016399 [Haemaphysalis longicornis]
MNVIRNSVVPIYDGGIGLLTEESAYLAIANAEGSPYVASEVVQSAVFFALTDKLLEVAQALITSNDYAQLLEGIVKPSGASYKQPAVKEAEPLAETSARHLLIDCSNLPRGQPEKCLSESSHPDRHVSAVAVWGQDDRTHVKSASSQKQPFNQKFVPKSCPQTLSPSKELDARYSPSTPSARCAHSLKFQERLTFLLLSSRKMAADKKYLRRLLTKTHKQAEVSPVYVVRQTRPSKCIAWPDEELQLLDPVRSNSYVVRVMSNASPPITSSRPKGLPRLPRPATRNHSLPSRATLRATSGGYASFFSTRFRGFLSLTDEVNALRQESARLQREAAKNSSLQAAAISSLQDEVRALRSELGRRKQQYPPLAPATGNKATEVSLTRAPLSVDTRKNLCAPENACRLFPCCRPQQIGPPPLKSARVTRADLCVKWPSERIPARESPVSPVDPPGKPCLCRACTLTPCARRSRLVNSVVTDESAVCTRLKSKYPSYASFHISTSADSLCCTQRC